MKLKKTAVEKKNKWRTHLQSTKILIPNFVTKNNFALTLEISFERSIWFQKNRYQSMRIFNTCYLSTFDIFRFLVYVYYINIINMLHSWTNEMFSNNMVRMICLFPRNYKHLLKLKTSSLSQVNNGFTPLLSL